VYGLQPPRQNPGGSQSSPGSTVPSPQLPDRVVVTGGHFDAVLESTAAARISIASVALTLPLPSQSQRDGAHFFVEPTACRSARKASEVSTEPVTLQQ
jgi:hypothetical protein